MLWKWLNAFTVWIKAINFLDPPTWKLSSDDRNYEANMNHLIAFRALLFQSKYHLIFKTDKISNILGLNLLKLRKFKLRPKKKIKIKIKKTNLWNLDQDCTCLNLTLVFLPCLSTVISIPRATKSVLDIACVDKVYDTSALKYFINPNKFDIFFHPVSLKLYVKEIYLAKKVTNDLTYEIHSHSILHRYWTLSEL